jgi:membrane protein implicated in regulation of membrane protease activity
MKKLMFATLAFVFLTTLVCLAQEPATQDNTKPGTPQEKQEHKSMGRTRTVTGCLQKGDAAGEFSITGEDGGTWSLRAGDVKLDDHVGHKVSVTGSANREPKAQAKAEGKQEGQMEKAASKEEYGDLSVTNLKMIRDTCSK